MIDKQAIYNVVETQLNGTDGFIVDVKVSKDNVIVVEIDSYSGVTIDDCIEVNNAIEEAFDRDEEDYELEVGSAGLTSPFKVWEQYDKNVGNDVEILTRDGKKHKGVLKSADKDTCTLTVSKKVRPEGAKRPVWVEEDLTFNYDNIKMAKYIIDGF